MPQPVNSHLSVVDAITPEVGAALQRLRLDSFADFEAGEDFRGDPAVFAASLERAAAGMGWDLRARAAAGGVFAELLGLGGRNVVQPPEVQHRYSEADLLRYLRRAAEHVGGAGLSGTGYERVRADLGGAAASTMVRRFGSWARACDAAGIAAAAPDGGEVLAELPLEVLGGLAA